MSVMLAAALVLLMAVAALGDDRPRPRSGLEFVAPGIRALQDDEFANPGMLWVMRGARLWHEPAEPLNRSCADCHGKAAPDIARYPRFDDRLARPVNLEGRINLCRTDQMAATPLAYESEPLLALTAYLRHGALGQPVVADASNSMASDSALRRLIASPRVRLMFAMLRRFCSLSFSR
mgnify:CR=1 FL=1